MATPASTVYEGKYSPRITLSRDADGNFTAVIEIEGIEPLRTTTTDERRAGIQSLDPPTIRARARRTEAQTIRNLIDASKRAVTSAATSTLGGTGGIGAIIMTHLRVALAMRAALRQLDEAIDI